MIERSVVNEIIDEEREYQDSKWVTDGKPTEHRPIEWLMIMQYYLNKGKLIAAEVEEPLGNDDIMIIIRKIAAIGVAAIEQNGCARREL